MRFKDRGVICHLYQIKSDFQCNQNSLQLDAMIGFPDTQRKIEGLQKTPADLRHEIQFAGNFTQPLNAFTFNKLKKKMQRKHKVSWRRLSGSVLFQPNETQYSASGGSYPCSFSKQIFC